MWGLTEWSQAHVEYFPESSHIFVNVRTAADIPCAAYTPPPPAHFGWGDEARWWRPAAGKASLLGGSQPMEGWASGWKTACMTSHLTPDRKIQAVLIIRWNQDLGKKTARKFCFLMKSQMFAFWISRPTWSLSWVSLQHFHCWKTSASLSRPAWWKWRILYWLSLLAITSWPLVHASSLQWHIMSWKHKIGADSQDHS